MYLLYILLYILKDVVLFVLLIGVNDVISEMSLNLVKAERSVSLYKLMFASGGVIVLILHIKPL